MFACFNRPYDGSDQGIHNFLLAAFESADQRSDVFGTYYKFNQSRPDEDDIERSTFADDLVRVAGKDSGQKLKFDFVGGNAGDSIDDNVKDALKDLKGSAKMYEGNPDDMMNHNKFFVFKSMDFQRLKRKQSRWAISSLPTSNRPALYLSSANSTTSSQGKHNNAILVPISGDMCGVIEDYFKDLKSEYKKISGIDALFSGNKKEDRYTTVKTDKCKVYLYPRRKENKPAQFTDTLVGVLKNTEHYKQSITSKKCEIYITIAGWYESRLELAETLARVAKNGATVSVISRKGDNPDEDIDMDTAIIKELEGNGVCQ